MSENKENTGIDHDPITDLPVSEFLAICAGWKEDMVKEEKWDKIQADFDANVLRCPVHQYAQIHGLCKQTVGGTKKCQICGHYTCPACMNHAADVVSRITGYIQVVSGWNAAKKQEFEERTRYKLN